MKPWIKRVTQIPTTMSDKNKSEGGVCEVFRIGIIATGSLPEVGKGGDKAGKGVV